jgi:hypothetical protein
VASLTPWVIQDFRNQKKKLLLSLFRSLYNCSIHHNLRSYRSPAAVDPAPKACRKTHGSVASTGMKENKKAVSWTPTKRLPPMPPSQGFLHYKGMAMLEFQC